MVGLALLRADGFAGLNGTGTIITVPINVTAASVTITADMLGNGSVRLGVKSTSGVRQNIEMPLEASRQTETDTQRQRQAETETDRDRDRQAETDSEGFFKGLSPEDCEDITTNVTSAAIR